MNIEKLAIEHGAVKFNEYETLGSSGSEPVFIFEPSELEAFAKALQSSEPVAWRWGNDNAWLLTDEKPVSCDASVMVQPLFTHPPASVPLEKYNKLLERLRVSNKHIKDWWNNFGEGGSSLPPAHSARLVDENQQAIAEAEGKEG